MISPKERMHTAANVITGAANLLRLERPTFEAFLKECDDIESFGHIVDPTLYRDPERRAVSALMQPLFQAALDFIAAYDQQIGRVKDALEKVSA